MSALTARFILAGTALLLCATSVFGGGAYQTTKDGKVTIWNDEPKPGDAATWVGRHDKEGYATGFGTLTWYLERRNPPIIFARYFGNMVHGKFEGPVNAHSKGKTAHALFTGGGRTSPWARGPAPSRNLAGLHAEPTLPADAESAQARDEATAERTRPKPKVAKTSATPPVVAQKRVEPARVESPPPLLPAPQAPPPAPQQTSKSMREADASVQSLVGPPSSLRSVSGETPAPTPFDPDPPLNRDEVVDLADTLARTHGYNISEYERSEAHHSETDDTWSISYEQKPGEGMAESAKHFSVTVDGKSKKASIVPGN
jgi:hypothetical protein